MKPAKHNIRLIGRREFVNLPQLGMYGVEAKIDTGAYTSSLHCESISVSETEAKPMLYLSVKQTEKGAETLQVLKFAEFSRKKIKNSFGEMEERFVIKTMIHIGKKKILSNLSLSNRDNMRYPLLIGRKLLKGKFVVDVNQVHTGGVNLTKAFNQLNKTKDL